MSWGAPEHGESQADEDKGLASIALAHQQPLPFESPKYDNPALLEQKAKHLETLMDPPPSLFVTWLYAFLTFLQPLGS